MDEKKKWILHHGIHRGTITSRDSDSQEYDTEAEARESFAKQKAWYRSIGYVIWFAELISPDGDKFYLDAGNSNWR